jgi:DNA-binding LytR/AlgR family response regulator
MRNTPLACIIADAVPLTSAALAQLIVRYCPLFAVAGIAATADALRAIMREVDPDVVFFDLDSPDALPVTVLNAASTDRPWYIVFTTTTERNLPFAAAPRILSLLKPVSVAELREVEKTVCGAASCHLDSGPKRLDQ